jgi:hypothetical protein
METKTISYHPATQRKQPPRKQMSASSTVPPSHVDLRLVATLTCAGVSVLPHRVLAPILEELGGDGVLTDSIRRRLLPRIFMQALCSSIATDDDFDTVVAQASSPAALLAFVGPPDLPQRGAYTGVSMDVMLLATYGHVLADESLWRGASPFGVVLMTEVLRRLSRAQQSSVDGTQAEKQAQMDDETRSRHLLNRIVTAIHGQLHTASGRVLVAALRERFNAENLALQLVTPLDWWYLTNAGAVPDVIVPMSDDSPYAFLLDSACPKPESHDIQNISIY